jgi:hypothetical protein
MNPNRGEGQGNFELPPQPGGPEAEKRQEQAIEAPAARPEQVGKQAKQPALPSVPDDIPAVDQPVIAAPPQDISSHSAATPTITDSDNIGHEWVDTVKSIASQTKDDPYTQKIRMSKVKAEYIEKRFNKQIKTDEAAA